MAQNHRRQWPERDGKAAIVATLHGKEQVIELALAGLGLHFLTVPSIDKIPEEIAERLNNQPRKILCRMLRAGC